MFRLSAFVQQRVSGFARVAGDAATEPLARRGVPFGGSNFVQRASHLKRRFRGKAQFAFARAEAQRFLDAEVPKTELSAWIEQDNNAIALSQVMNFFEVEMQDTSLASLLLNKLVRTAETSSTPAATVSAQSRLEAVLALLSMRPEENYERACATVDDVLRHLHDSPSSHAQQWRVLDHCAKVLQRCGRRVTTDTNARLASAVAAQIQRTPLAELATEQSSLLRVYAWMARADMNEADALLEILMANVGHMRAFEFATLMASVWRHHQFRPLSVDTMKALARDGLQYCTSANGRDMAVILGTIARLLSSAQQQPPAAESAPASTTLSTRQAVGHLADRFAALLEDYQPRVLDMLDPAHALYWKKSEDVVAIAYAYELGGRARHRAVFVAFHRYVQKEVAALEPTQLALTVGILHRSVLLSTDVLGPLSERLEHCLGELRLPELSHVCAALASTAPSWLAEAEAVALRLVEQADSAVSPATYLQLALAFPQVPAFANGVDCAEMSVRQLMDGLLAVLQTPYEGPATAALVQRLASPSERFTPDDVHLLRTCQRRELADAAAAYLHARFAEPQWVTDTLFCAPLADAGEVLARDVRKAMQAATEASVSPELFVSLVELLTGLFGASEAEVAGFVRKGGVDLLTGHDVLLRTIVRYLGVIRRYPAVFPATEWLQAFTEKVSHMHRPVLRADELESLLISLHAMYRHCQQTPALQVLLSELAQVYYDGSGETGLRCTGTRGPAAGIETARVTVLLAHLQQGMSLPLLTATTPTVIAVRGHASTYSADVQQAVRSMPLPTAATAEAEAASPVQRGRFTLKPRPTVATATAADDVDVDAAEEDGHDSAPHVREEARHRETASAHGERSLAGLTVLEEDPFAMDAIKPADAPVASPLQSSPLEPSTVSEPLSMSSPAADSAAGVSSTAPHPSSSPDHGTTDSHGGSSYYAKFFQKTVGQILSSHRKGGAHDDEDELSHHRQPAATPVASPVAADTPVEASVTSAAAAPARRPHRTSLRPLAAGSAPTSAMPTLHPTVAPIDEPTVAPTIAPAPAPDTPPVVRDTSDAHTTLFGALFGTAAPTTAETVPPAAPIAQTAQTPPEPSSENPAAAAFAQLFSSTPAAETPAAPATPPTSASSSSTPVPPVPRVLGARPHGGHVFVDPSKSTGLSAAPASASPGQPALRPRPVMSRRPSVTSPAMGTASLEATSEPTSAADSGVVQFMNQAGLAKVTGYDVTAAEAPVSVAPSFSAQGGRLAWQETARQLARVTRGQSRTKAGRGRTQTSLSEWLSTPDATLEDAEAAAGAGTDKNKRGRKGKAAPPPPVNVTTPTAPVVPAKGSRKGAKSAAVATPPKARRGVAASKPRAAAKAAKGGKAPKAAKPAKGTKAAKPAKVVKAAKPAKVAKKAAAKKPAPAAASKKAAKKPAVARKVVKKAAAAAKPKPKAKPKAKAKGKKK